MTGRYKYLIYACIALLTCLASCRTSKETMVQEQYYTKDATSLVDSILAATLQNTPNDEVIHKMFKISKSDNKKLYSEATKWLGTPYKYGGCSLKGTDCSGMVMKIYDKVYNIKLERNSAMMLKRNCNIIYQRALREGDLVFFAPKRNKDAINHVGIYLKDGKFLHASSSRGVIVSELADKYYQNRFVCGGRVVQ